MINTKGAWHLFETQRIILCAALVYCGACSSGAKQDETPAPQATPPKANITVIRTESILDVQEINASEKTKRTWETLLSVTRKYPVKPFIFKKEIQIQSGVPLSSEPSLTINTLWADHPQMLLMDFLYLQMDYFVSDKLSATEACGEEILKVAEKPPFSFNVYPRKTILRRLVVNWLEYRAASKLLGKPMAEKLVKQRGSPNWVYRQVLKNDATIEKLLKERNLIPSQLFEE